VNLPLFQLKVKYFPEGFLYRISIQDLKQPGRLAFRISVELCASMLDLTKTNTHHGDTEGTEDTQRRQEGDRWISLEGSVGGQQLPHPHSRVAEQYPGAAHIRIRGNSFGVFDSVTQTHWLTAKQQPVKFRIHLKLWLRWRES
jgi:hypothetical protein